MKKKILALTLLATLAVSTILMGCGSGNKATDSSSSTKTESNEAKSDVPTLKWYIVGGGMPENYDAWINAVNEYIEPKVGAKLDLEVTVWGDWDAKRNTLITTNQPFDIIFGNDATFAKDVAVGALADISNELKETPGLTDLIPEDYWKPVTVGGAIYGVPTYKDSSITMLFVWDKDMLDKYEVADWENKNTVAAVADDLIKIAEGEGKPSFPLFNGGVHTIFVEYDSFGVGIPVVGVKYNDESAKVVNPLEQEDIMSELKAVRKLYEAKAINQDAFTLGEVAPVGTICGISQGWPMAAETIWGPQRNINAVTAPYSRTIVSNQSVLGSINSISANSQHKVEALKLLELLNTDTKLRDMFFYGLEGEDFNYVDGRVEKLHESWPMAGYAQATFFNVSQLVGVEKNQWDEVKELNANATPSVLLGFQLDRTNIEGELANVNQVWQSAAPELLTGAKDPEAGVAELKEKLQAAGYDKIVEEAQKQIDEWMKTK